MGFLSDIYSDIGDRLSMYDMKGLRRFLSIYGTVLVLIVVGAVYGTKIVGEQSASASYKFATMEIAKNKTVVEILGEVQLMTLLSHRGKDGAGAVHYIISVQGKGGKGDVSVDVVGEGPGGADKDGGRDDWVVGGWYLLYNGVRHDLSSTGPAGPDSATNP